MQKSNVIGHIPLTQGQLRDIVRSIQRSGGMVSESLQDQITVEPISRPMVFDCHTSRGGK